MQSKNPVRVVSYHEIHEYCSNTGMTGDLIPIYSDIISVPAGIGKTGYGIGLLPSRRASRNASRSIIPGVQLGYLIIMSAVIRGGRRAWRGEGGSIFFSRAYHFDILTLVRITVFCVIFIIFEPSLIRKMPYNYRT